MKAKNTKIVVQNIEISISTIHTEDYISLTDMLKAKDGDFFVSDWLRNANTLEYLKAWEQIYNPNFNYGEFATIRSQAGVNSYKISVKEWLEKTNAVGIFAKTGRYGGTYAHKDIAFHFGMWISPVFQLYIVKEYQHLKEIENNRYNLEWNAKRILSKANYQLQTDAIQKHIIPKLNSSQRKDLIYAEEADILNYVLFGCTAKDWKQANPERAKNGENIRDMASINELIVLVNLESMNSELIKQNIDKQTRINFLQKMANEQKENFKNLDYMKSLKKLSDKTFLAENQKGELPSKSGE